MELEGWEHWGVGEGNGEQGVAVCKWGQEAARWCGRRCWGGTWPADCSWLWWSWYSAPVRESEGKMWADACCLQQGRWEAWWAAWKKYAESRHDAYGGALLAQHRTWQQINSSFLFSGLIVCKILCQNSFYWNLSLKEEEEEGTDLNWMGCMGSSYVQRSSNLISSPAFPARYFYQMFHFIDEETEAQKDYIISPRPHNQEEAGLVTGIPSRLQNLYSSCYIVMPSMERSLIFFFKWRELVSTDFSYTPGGSRRLATWATPLLYFKGAESIHDLHCHKYGKLGWFSGALMHLPLLINICSLQPLVLGSELRRKLSLLMWIRHQLVQLCPPWPCLPQSSVMNNVSCSCSGCGSLSSSRYCCTCSGTLRFWGHFIAKQTSTLNSIFLLEPLQQPLENLKSAASLM